MTKSRESIDAYYFFIYTLDDVFMVDGVDLGTGQNDARPGSTIENAQTVVGVDDLDTEMELALEELFSFGGDEFTTFINLSELQ